MDSLNLDEFGQSSLKPSALQPLLIPLLSDVLCIERPIVLFLFNFFAVVIRKPLLFAACLSNPLSFFFSKCRS